jgi:hypothetical protein
MAINFEFLQEHERQAEKGAKKRNKTSCTNVHEKQHKVPVCEKIRQPQNLCLSLRLFIVLLLKKNRNY